MSSTLDALARRLGVAPDAVDPRALFDLEFPGVAACLRDSPTNPRAEQAASHGRILLDGARTGEGTYADSFNTVVALLSMPGTAEAIAACGARVPAPHRGGSGMGALTTPGAAPPRAGRAVAGVAAALGALGLALAVLRPAPLARFLGSR